MKNKYLQITLKSLFVKYGLIYVAFFMAIIFSGHSPIAFSVGYWALCLVLIALEGFGSYVLITDKEVVWHSWYFYKFTIPLGGIISFKKGISYSIDRSECILMLFKFADGRESTSYILPFQYTAADIKKFVTKVSSENPKVVVEENVKSFFAKRSK